MLLLAFRNLIRRPLRTGLTLFGLAVAVAVLAALTAFGSGYRTGLRTELDRMGMQMMLVPIGCPYDAAARIVKGKSLDTSLPFSAVEAARRDPAVAVAAPLLMAAVPRPEQGRTDMWCGLDQEGLKLRPWWKAARGEAWFTGSDSVILGAEAASVEMRSVGDVLNSPETGRSFRVVGILERSGTSDDSLFFVPVATAQEMFAHQGRLTAVAIRLKDPAALEGASERLQQIEGAQVVTLTEMMGTFLQLIGSLRTLLFGITAVAVVASALGVFNTLFGSVMEQMPELALMRAFGASRAQVFTLISAEALMFGLGGTVLGLLVTGAFGGLIEGAARAFVPLAPSGSLLLLDGGVVAQALAVGIGVAVAAGVIPAWWASRAAPAREMRAAA